MSEEAGLSRRHFLTVATSVTGVVGLGLVVTPFIESFRPSARAQALGAPVEVDISKLEEGALLRLTWRGQAVWVLRRSKEMLTHMEDEKIALKDPDSNESEQPTYCKNTDRSIKPGVLVVLANCTHLGCIPVPRFAVADPELGADWPGGFFCPCHGSRFDLSARVVVGSPAPTNLRVPPYRFVGDSVLIIGEDTGAKA
jgi:ubiquinol-cytochrome c reductase iron-sulfur subunit